MVYTLEAHKEDIYGVFAGVPKQVGQEHQRMNEFEMNLDVGPEVVVEVDPLIALDVPNQMEMYVMESNMSSRKALKNGLFLEDVSPEDRERL